MIDRRAYFSRPSIFLARASWGLYAAAAAIEEVATMLRRRFENDGPEDEEENWPVTHGKIPRLALAIVALVYAVQGRSTPEPAKSAKAVLDYSQPVYTVDHAIVCPMRTLIASYLDAPAARRPEAIAALYISAVDRESREKTLGCEEWAEGVKVKAVELEQRPEGLALVQINGSFFTAKADLTNNPGR